MDASCRQKILKTDPSEKKDNIDIFLACKQKISHVKLPSEGYRAIGGYIAAIVSQYRAILRN